MFVSVVPENKISVYVGTKAGKSQQSLNFLLSHLSFWDVKNNHFLPLQNVSIILSLYLLAIIFWYWKLTFFFIFIVLSSFFCWEETPVGLLLSKIYKSKVQKRIKVDVDVITAWPELSPKPLSISFSFSASTAMVKMVPIWTYLIFYFSIRLNADKTSS